MVSQWGKIDVYGFGMCMCLSESALGFVLFYQRRSVLVGIN